MHLIDIWVRHTDVFNLRTPTISWKFNVCGLEIILEHFLIRVQAL